MKKAEILQRMRVAYESDDYYHAYKVYNENQLDYPRKEDFHKREEDVKANFRGTLAEVTAEIEKAKSADAKDYKDHMWSYNHDSAELRSTLIELAAYEGLPSEVSNNRDFVNAISYYALSESEPYNWASEFSEFWDCFEKAQAALKK